MFINSLSLVLEQFSDARLLLKYTTNYFFLSFPFQQLQSAVERNETMVLAVSLHWRRDSGSSVVQAASEAIGVRSKHQSSN